MLMTLVCLLRRDDKLNHLRQISHRLCLCNFKISNEVKIKIKLGNADKLFAYSGKKAKIEYLG